MKLLRVHVISAETCGGLLDDLDLWLRSPSSAYSTFDPLCFVGPNGAGKSQFLQVLAEMFQSVLHACVGAEERVEGNSDLQFELEYLICPDDENSSVHVRISRKMSGKQRPNIVIERKEEYEWEECDIHASDTHKLLPQSVFEKSKSGRNAAQHGVKGSDINYAFTTAGAALIVLAQATVAT